jgi:hypothetical protein
VFATIPPSGVLERGDDIQLYCDVFKDYQTEVASLKEGTLSKNYKSEVLTEQNFEER